VPQRSNCSGLGSGRCLETTRDRSGLVRPVGFSGIEDTGGLRGMGEVKYRDWRRRKRNCGLGSTRSPSCPGSIPFVRLSEMTRSGLHAGHRRS
jgi:hypothetical protein